MKSFIVNIIIPVVSISLLLFNIGCGQQSVTEKKYGIVFNDSTVLEHLQTTTGSEKISGFIEEYYIPLGPRLKVSITFENPQNIDIESMGDEIDKSMLDSIILSIGMDSPYDVLEVHFTKKTSFWVFNSESEHTITYNSEIISPIRMRLFPEWKILGHVFNSKVAGGDFQSAHSMLDSLSRIKKYRALVFDLHVLALMYEDKKAFILFKDSILQEFSSRPFDLFLHQFLGYISFYEKRYEESSKHLDFVLPRVPSHILTNYYRGLCYLEAHDYPSAMKHFQRVKERGSTMADDVIRQLKERGY